MVVDQGRRLKNSESKLVKVLQKFKAYHRVLLTGTAIHDDPREVWALLNVLKPEWLMCEKEFIAKFDKMQDAKTIDELKSLLLPFMLLRLKGDVDKSIMPKEETIIYVEATPNQKIWYRAVQDRNCHFLA